MSLAFYLDEHVPAVIAEGLRQRGVDVLTVQEDERTGFSDLELLDRAKELGRVVFSWDTDFLREASRRQQEQEEFSGIIYAHPLRVTIGQCVVELEFISTAIELEDLANTVLYLPL